MCGYLVNFPLFGTLHKEKSGNPGPETLFPKKRSSHRQTVHFGFSQFGLFGYARLG
jgi:hypothetical protein